MTTEPRPAEPNRRPSGTLRLALYLLTFVVLVGLARTPPWIVSICYLLALALRVGQARFLRMRGSLPGVASRWLRLLTVTLPFVLTFSTAATLFRWADGFLLTLVALLGSLVPLFITLALSLWVDLAQRGATAAATADNEPLNGLPTTPMTVPDNAIWNTLPNGLRYRTDWTGEIGMGGPQTYCHVFSNGIELGDGTLYVSVDGHYAASTGVGSSTDIAFADLENGRVRVWSSSDDAARLARIAPDLARMADCLDAADTEQYVAHHGLWLPADAELAPETITLTSPAGNRQMRCDALLDATHLLGGDSPRQYLQNPLYHLTLIDAQGERALPVETTVPDAIVWSDDGNYCLIPSLPGYQAERRQRDGAMDSGTHWLWCADETNAVSRWVNPRQWSPDASLSSSSVGEVVALDAAGYELAITLNASADDGYPQRFRNLRSPSAHHCGTTPSTWVCGADERGRLIVASPGDARYDEAEARHAAHLLTVRCAWDQQNWNHDGDGIVTSRPRLDDGIGCARFIPQRSTTFDSLLPYRLEVGAITIEAVSLFHLWSDCRRYLVLQAPLARHATPDTFFVLDTLTGTRFDTPYRACNVQLIAHHNGELQVSHVLGCVPDNYDFAPFTPVAPPPTPEAGSYLRHEWLLMESVRFHLTEAGIVGPLPKHVELAQPPYPNAAFDFIYRAPNGQRSVFVFGARNEYQDNYPREQCCRYQARAITSNGICLDQLGVGMLWSDDGHYLVVTSRVPPEHPDYDDLAWYARLLDCEQRVIWPAIALGCMPIFESFAASAIHYRRVDVDWWREDVESEAAILPLADLRRGKPTALIGDDGLWLLPDTRPSPEWRKTYARIYPA